MEKLVKTLPKVEEKPTTHLVLLPVWSPTGKGERVLGTAQRVTERWVVRLVSSPDGVKVSRPLQYDSPDGLRGLLASTLLTSGPLTLWLARGWTDFVGSGLAELCDADVYRLKWACLDGEKVLLDGKMEGITLRTSSLSAWTGGAWDSWRDAAVTALRAAWDLADDGTAGLSCLDLPADALCAVATVRTILSAVRELNLGPQALTIGAQARRWWRTWGGPRLLVSGTRVGGTKRRPKWGRQEVVVPISRRPRLVAGAEGHACHGLVREQYARGHCAGPVVVLDLRAAYLQALARSPLPLVYSRSDRRPPVSVCKDRAATHVGLALCRVESPDRPYLTCSHDRSERSVGTYWTWLCGCELALALRAGIVSQVHVAHWWESVMMALERAQGMLRLADVLRADGHLDTLAVWRGIYSSLCGTWAQVRWEWEDDPRPSQVGRWATWTMAGAEEGTTEHWRCVAGQVQRRVYRGEAWHACPIAYACVTSWVRAQVDGMRRSLGEGAVLATACDALWLTAEGLERYEAQVSADPPWKDCWRVKDRWDECWLDGKGGAVARKGDLLYPKGPGIPHGVALDAAGVLRWERSEPWTDGLGGGADAPRTPRVARWSGRALVRANDGPLTWGSPWRTLDAPERPAGLEAPYDPCTARRRWARDDDVTEEGGE